MKTHFLCLSIALLMNINSLKAQRFFFYGGGELGISNSIAYIQGSDEDLFIRALAGPPIFGGYLGLQYRNIIWTEFGVYSHSMGAPSWCLKSGFGECGTGWADRQLELTQRIGYNLNIYKKKWLLTPTVGYRLGFNNVPNQWNFFETDTTGSNNNELYLKRELNKGLNQIYHLLETGLQLSYQDPKGWKISIFGRCMHGFQRIWETRFEYKYKDGPSGNGVYWQNGGYWMYGLSAGYIFGIGRQKA